MGDCDRFKNYISDYLEDALDPTTRSEFEKAMENSPDLRKMTHKISILKSGMQNLSYQACSEDFSLKLRERIHTTPHSIVSRQNIVRFSFAFSFIVIVAFATFSLDIFSNTQEGETPVLKSSEFQNQTTNPVPNPASGKSSNAFSNEGVIDVKTKGSQEARQDSSRFFQNQNPEKLTRPVEQRK